MPINKNALLRYRTLDRCLQNKGRHYYFEDLLNAVNKLFWQKESAERNIRDLIDEKKVLLERKAFLKNRLKEKSKDKRK